MTQARAHQYWASLFRLADRRITDDSMEKFPPNGKKKVLQTGTGGRGALFKLFPSIGPGGLSIFGNPTHTLIVVSSEPDG